MASAELSRRMSLLEAQYEYQASCIAILTQCVRRARCQRLTAKCAQMIDVSAWSMTATAAELRG